jgi:hypothetical protein
MKFPSRLRIGGHSIKVVVCELPEDTDGEFSTDTNIIKISKGLTASQKQATLLHEILHALNAYFDEEPYHALLESLSQQLYQVLKNNKLHFDDP